MSVEFELYFSSDANYEKLLAMVPKDFECLESGEYKTSNIALTISEPGEEELEDLSLELKTQDLNNLFSFDLTSGMDLIAGQNEIIRVLANVLELDKSEAVLVVGGSSLLMQKCGDLTTLYDKGFWSDERLALLPVTDVSYRVV